MASQGLDALVYPNSQVLPPTREELDDWKWTVLTFPTNALIAAQADLPSISLPAGFAEGGVPVGFELVGKPYGEPDLLRLAYAYEGEAQRRRPPESAPTLSDEPQ
jgi:amidase